MRRVSERGVSGEVKRSVNGSERNASGLGIGGEGSWTPTRDATMGLEGLKVMDGNVGNRRRTLDAEVLGAKVKGMEKAEEKEQTQPCVVGSDMSFSII